MEANALPQGRLKREMGLVGLLFCGLGAIVGSGWLFAPFFAAQIAGPAAILSWVIAAVICMFNVLVIAELACMFPLSGSVIRWAHFSHGGFMSYIVALSSWLAFVTLPPIEVSGILEYMDNYFPALDKTVNNAKVLSTPGLLVAIVLIMFITWINYQGVQWFAKINNTITVWKLIVPFITPVILITVGFNAENFTSAGGFAPTGMQGVLSAISTSGVIFAYCGARTVADMAGESRDPQRHIPLATIGALVACLILYVTLQVAFIGVTDPASLSQGWTKIADVTASGPFAAMASALGLTWLAFILYSDAIISPSGTALIYTSVTARTSYAMSRNGYFPKIMEKLNASRVPGWGLAINGILGCLMFLPFPGWQQLVGVISSAQVLALAFASVAMQSLRLQLPQQYRPFRLPYGRTFAAISFTACTLMLYWTGWATQWKILTMLLVGVVVILPLSKLTNQRRSDLNLRSGTWVFAYLSGLGLLSYLGTFGGIAVLPPYLDQVVVIAFSLIIFTIAIRSRTTTEQTQAAIALTLRLEQEEAETIDDVRPH